MVWDINNTKTWHLACTCTWNEVLETSKVKGWSIHDQILNTDRAVDIQYDLQDYSEVETHREDDCPLQNCLIQDVIIYRKKRHKQVYKLGGLKMEQDASVGKDCV